MSFLIWCWFSQRLQALVLCFCLPIPKTCSLFNSLPPLLVSIIVIKPPPITTPKQQAKFPLFLLLSTKNSLEPISNLFTIILRFLHVLSTIQLAFLWRTQFASYLLNCHFLGLPQFRLVPPSTMIPLKDCFCLEALQPIVHSIPQYQSY